MLRPYLPSFPRKRESKLILLNDPNKMDSPFRENDDFVVLIGVAMSSSLH
jgi:hypothetical protein